METSESSGYRMPFFWTKTRLTWRLPRNPNLHPRERRETRRACGGDYHRITALNRPSGVRRWLEESAALTIGVALGLSMLLQGCGAVVVGGVATGAAVIYDRRPAQVVIDDQEIMLQAVDLAQKNPDIGQHSRITTTAYNHVALLTGQADTAAISDRYAVMVSNLPKVREVVNEVTIGPMASIARASEDTYITSRAKFVISQVDLPGFDATRVKVVTESAVVYLMGLVSPDEANATIEKVRYIPGVKRVVTLFEDIDTSRTDP